MDRTIDSLQQSTTSLLRTLSVPQDNEHVVSLMKDFESARNVFDDLDNPYKMTKYFESEFSLVKPKELFLGHRADTTRRGGLIKQSLTTNTFQYISIFETLKFIFCNEKMQSLYLDSHKGTDGKMRDYCDGAHFAGHDLYQKHPSVLQIQLYFDDLETTNPLGSKTKIHKMGAVYFSLRNLQLKFNSGLANIHLCLLFNSIDRETYGFGKIFEPLLDDIRLLECHGIEIEMKGELHLLYGTVCLFTGDNLACHFRVAIWKAFLLTSSAIFALLIKICHKWFLMKASLKDETERITSSMLL